MPQAGINDERDYASSTPIPEESVSVEPGLVQENVGDNKDTSEAESAEKSLNLKNQEISNVEKSKFIDSGVKEALLANMASYNGYELMEKYPKSYKALFDYVSAKSQVQIDEETLVGTLYYAPRTVLFDFFDEKKLFLNVLGFDNEWAFTVNNNNPGDTYQSRVIAEVTGTHACFYELEKSLENQ